jgi:ligand-binding sensor domain-containing protein
VFARPFIKAKRSGLALVLLPLILSALARAERLPLKAYTVADGLGHNNVNKIVRDSRGFLWFCTNEGLSRFDGYSFTNYDTNDGLPHHAVTDFLQTRDGELWVGTNGGLVHFNPRGLPNDRAADKSVTSQSASPRFTVVLPEDENRNAKAITVLLEARDGTIWCGTLRGLYRLESIAGRFALRPVDLKMPTENQEQSFVLDLLEDRHGSLWVAAASGLYRRWADGSVARYTSREGLLGMYLQDLFEDSRGQMWAATREAGFFRFVADETHAPPAVVRMYQKWDGVTVWVYQIFETSDHRFWAATNSGLVEFSPDSSNTQSQFHTYSTKNGLAYSEITTLNEDMSGNLWLGSYAGAMKLARDGFVTYSEQEGVVTVSGIFEDRRNETCFRGYVVGDEHTSVFEGAKIDLLSPAAIHHFRYGCFDGRRFRWFLPSVPRSGNFGWVGEGVTLQARNGEWWLGTGEGLYRFPATDDFAQLKNARPLAIYQTKEGLVGYQQVFRIFEDSRGDIWASTAAAPNGLARWERATGALFRDLADSSSLPSPAGDLARSFAEDATGNIWIGFGTGLARYRDGRFTFFSAKDGLPAGAIQDIHSDHRGRLWLASARSGLIRVDDPGAERPTYAIVQGLSSDSAGVITEDTNGRIYVGTGRGLDRLDPETGRVNHFTGADGLAGGDLLAAFRDRDGALWFGAQKSGSSNYIQNITTQQPSTNFNISANGTIGGNLGIGTSSTQAKLEIQTAALAIPVGYGFILSDDSSNVARTRLGSYVFNPRRVLVVHLAPSLALCLMTTLIFLQTAVPS